MAHLLTVNITKSPRGWSIDSEVLYEGMKHPARTGQGAPTLAWALYKGLESATRDDTDIVSITVNGRLMPGIAAWQTMQNKWAGTNFEYLIKPYKAPLLMMHYRGRPQPA